MQVWNVLHAARWIYRTQKLCKNRHLGTIPQLCRAISSQLSHVSTIEKKLFKQQYLLHMSHNMVNGPLAAEIISGVCQLLSTASASWQPYCTASSSERQPNFAALNRGRHLCSAGWPSRWALARSSNSVWFLNYGELKTTWGYDTLKLAPISST